MSKFEEAIERIKILECPTGNLENRVAGILEGYEIAGRNGVSVKRAESYDRDGAQAYIAKTSGIENKNIVILAESGIDDYVAKVVDVYIS